MKKIILGLSLFLLVGCSSDESDPIEEPSKPTSEIESNENLISSYREALEKDEKNYKNAEDDMVEEMYADLINEWEQKIKATEDEIKQLEKTYIYNDDFCIVDGTAVLIDKNDGIGTKDSFVSGFSELSLETLKKYDEKITDGAILLAATTFESEGDKFPIISVYYSQDSLESIDFETALKERNRNDYLYRDADYVKVHADLQGNLSEKGIIDNVPDLFLHYEGQTY